MAGSRVIVLIETKRGVVYELDKPTAEGHLVKSITFRRDGLTSINLGDGDCSNYLLELVDPISKSEVVFKVIPSEYVQEIVFIVETKQKSDETAKTMRRE